MHRKTLHKCIMPKLLLIGSVIAKNSPKNSDVKIFKMTKISNFGEKSGKSKNQISKLLKVQKNNKELDDLEPRINFKKKKKTYTIEIYER